MKYAPQAMSFNGVYLENVIPGYLTQSVGGRETVEIEVKEDDDIETLDGSLFVCKRTPPKTIQVAYQVVADNEMQLHQYFHTIGRYIEKAQSKVIFDDEPDKFWIGTVIKHEITLIADTIMYGGFDIYCNDPYCYSTTLKTATAVKNDDGELVIHLDNQGNRPCSIDYEITHKGDNGFIGLVHEKGVMQFGKTNLADTPDVGKGTKIFDTKNDNDEGWEVYTGVHPQNKNIFIGDNRLAFENGKFVWKTRVKPTGDTSKYSAYGGCMRYTLENPTENFYTWFNQQFSTSKLAQTGHNQVTLADEDNNIIAAFATSKTDMNSNTAYARFYIGDNGKEFTSGTRGNSVFKTNYFQADLRGSSYGNPYVTTGCEDILKEGGLVRFYYSGSYFSIYNEDLVEARVKYVYVFIGNHMKNTMDCYCENTFDISGTDFSGSAWKDVDNKYSNETVCRIDGTQGTYTVNGILTPQDEAVGTTWFKADPGMNDIYVKFSTWSTEDHDITAYYRERWY